MLLRMAVERFLLDRRQRGCVAGTLTTYRYQLDLLVRFLKAHHVTHLEKVRRTHIESFWSDMRFRANQKYPGVLSPVTIKKRMLAVRSFFHYCRRARLCRGDPAKNLPVPKAGKRKPKALAPAQVAQLLDRAHWRLDEWVARDYAALLVMLDAGLRLGEVAALDLSDLDLARGLVHVRHGKGDKERWSVYIAPTADALKDWIVARRRCAPPGEPALFVNRAGDRLTRLALYRAVKRRAQQAGLERDVSPHKLRHTMITLYLNAGGKLHVAQMLAGHESITTTIGYTSVAMTFAAREHEQYSPLKTLAELKR